MSIHSDTGPFTIIPEWVLLHPDLGANAVRLYGLLGRYADNGGRCHPGRQELADKLGISERTLDKAMGELVTAGAVESTARYLEGTKERTSNTYLVVRKKPDSAPGGAESATTGGAESAVGTRTKTLNENETLTGFAQPLVAAFVDRSRALGSEPPKRVVGQLAREVAGLLSEGVTPERVEQGFAIMLDRGLHPSTLASCVHQAGLPPPKRNGRGVDLDALFAEINAELRAEAAS